MKGCSKCGEVKPLEDFSRRRRSKDGRQSYCKVCSHRKTRQWEADNPTRHKEINRAAVDRHHAAHSGKVNARRRKRYVERRKTILGRMRQLYRENPEKFIQRVAARERTAGPVDPEYAVVLRNDPCSYCGGYSDRTMEIDHIVPVAAGGGSDLLNVTAACRFCNSSKSTKDVLTHLLEGMTA